MANSVLCLSDLVYIPDPYLRAVVNNTLGKNGMDALTQCDMTNLTSLNAAGMGISNLTGMQYAVNLTSADLRNNNITDTSPLNGLPLHPIIQITGNPGTPPPTMPPDYNEPVATPALSLPGFIMTIIAVAAFVVRKRKRQSPFGGIFMMIMILAVMFAISKPSLAADIKNSAKELDSQQLQQVQKIGQTVLAAKKSTPVDPELKTLQQKVKDLREAIAALDSSMLPIRSIPTVSLKTDVTTSFEASRVQKEQKQQLTREERENKVRSVLSEVRKQRAFVMTERADDTAEHAYLKRTVADKVEKLENKVDDLLSTPHEQRAAKIKSLKERLTATKPEQLSKSDKVKKTPTFSTIERHLDQ